MAIILPSYRFVCEFCERPSPPQEHRTMIPKGWVRLRCHRPYESNAHYFCCEFHKKAWQKRERSLKDEW